MPKERINITEDTVGVVTKVPLTLHRELKVTAAMLNTRIEDLVNACLYVALPTVSRNKLTWAPDMEDAIENALLRIGARDFD